MIFTEAKSDEEGDRDDNPSSVESKSEAESATEGAIDENDSSNESQDDTSSSMEESEPEDEDSSVSTETGNLLERLRNDDPTLTDVIFSSNISKRKYYALVEALQTNRIVEQIICQFNRIDDEEYSPLLNVIRTRIQLRALFMDFSDSFDISPFILAGAANPALESLHFNRSPRYSTESIASLQSHPNLQEIAFDLRLSYDDPTKIELIKQIIEKCPLLHRVQLRGAQFTVKNWKPIIQALNEVQPDVFLGIEHCTFDEDATILLQDFLHNSPASVDFSLEVVGNKFPPFESSSSLSSSRLPRLLGPSVRKLRLVCDWSESESKSISNSIIQEIKQVIMRLNEEEMRNMRDLTFRIYNDDCCFGDSSKAVVDDIRNLLFVNEVCLHFSPGFVTYDLTPVDLLRGEVLAALAKNVSIQKLTVQFLIYGCRDIIHWTDAEKERLEYLLKRNASISQLLRTPNSFPLSIWPRVLESAQKIESGLNLVFQCLHGLVDCLPDTTMQFSGRRAKRKVEL